VVSAKMASDLPIPIPSKKADTANTDAIGTSLLDTISRII